MTAIDTLNANILALQATVALVLPDINPLPGTGATEAQVASAATQVAAINTALQAAITTPVTGVPAVPASVVPTASTGGTVSLAFPAVPGAASYNVKRSNTSGGPYATVGSPTTNAFKEGGLPVGVTVFYVVSAVNAAGESANSTEVSAAAVA